MHTKAIALATVVTLIAVNQLTTPPLIQQNDQPYEQQSLQIQSLQMNFQQLFGKWKIIHSKQYHSKQEQIYRFQIFKNNCQIIYNHNLYMDDFGYTFWYALNQFSDLTQQQYLHQLNTYQSRNFYKRKLHQSQLLNSTIQCTGKIINSPNPPDQVDWTKKAVTPVLDQGKCGSSYAISAIGAIQGLYSLRIGKLQTFSVQQILDCSQSYGNQGCFGGFMDQAFWYIIDNGLATSKNYPIKNDTAKQSCKYTKSMKATTFSICADVPSGSYIKLQSAVIQQPTSIAIDASGLQNYGGGIYNGECSDSYINQAMLIVGYGSQGNQTYWKIKNSFGTKWGENGYLLLERQLNDGAGKCGINLVGVVPQSIV